MSIRPARPDDLPAVRAIARAAYAPYVARLGFEPPPMVADFEAALRVGELHVADDPVAGYVVFGERDGHVLLENVAVDPRAHGRGCGRRLIAFAERFARERRRAVVLYTNAAMRENLSLYPRLGYRETDRRVENGLSRIYFRKDDP